MATNPFRYGALALDDAFTDRKAELDELLADIRNGQDIVVFAPRRYGKSSLVWRAAQRLRKTGVLVAQVNLMTTPTKEKLAEKLAETIHDDIAPPLFRGFIESQFAKTGRMVEPYTVERVLDTTHGHPYATQELCYFLWEETPEGGTVGAEQYETALTKLLRSEHAHFGLVWDK